MNRHQRKKAANEVGKVGKVDADTVDKASVVDKASKEGKSII